MDFHVHFSIAFPLPAFGFTSNHKASENAFHVQLAFKLISVEPASALIVSLVKFKLMTGSVVILPSLLFGGVGGRSSLLHAVSKMTTKKT